jgi:hypothetical protein
VQVKDGMELRVYIHTWPVLESPVQKFSRSDILAFSIVSICSPAMETSDDSMAGWASSESMNSGGLQIHRLWVGGEHISLSRGVLGMIGKKTPTEELANESESHRHVNLEEEKNCWLSRDTGSSPRTLLVVGGVSQMVRKGRLSGPNLRGTIL